VVADRGLREVDVGSWSGLTRREIDERFPGHERHDGETRDAHSARVVGALERIAHAHRGERILVVSHGGSLGALRRHAGVEYEGRLENCSVFELHFRDGSFVGVD
jgi:probable phosphoglycerate mutase